MVDNEKNTAPKEDASEGVSKAKEQADIAQSTSDQQQVPHPTKTVLTAQQLQQRKRRNIAIGLMIFGFVIVVYLVTLLRLGASVTDRSF